MKLTVESEADFQSRLRYIKERADQQRKTLREKVTDEKQLKYGLKVIRRSELRCLADAYKERQKLK